MPKVLSTSSVPVESVSAIRACEEKALTSIRATVLRWLDVADEVWPVGVWIIAFFQKGEVPRRRAFVAVILHAACATLPLKDLNCNYKISNKPTLFRLCLPFFGTGYKITNTGAVDGDPHKA